MDVERGMGVRLSLWEENEAQFNVKSKWRTAHGFKDVNSSCCFDGFALSQCGEAEAAQPGVFLCLKENKLFALQLCWKKMSYSCKVPSLEQISFGLTVLFI